MPTILIVDDAPINIRHLTALAEDLGHIISTNDGNAAFELAAKHQPSLILLDVVMPGINGYDVCRQLKADPLTQAIPVIFVTGADSQIDEATGLDAGAIDYITKPFVPELVRCRIRNHLNLVRANEELRRLAVTDALTGIANRRHLLESGERELARARRQKEALCLLMIDIDHFKRINDGWGHPVGDNVICALAKLCVDTVRTIDTVGRLGGEEFALILPLTQITGAAEVAERIRQGATRLEFPTERPLRFTVSIGVAEADTSADIGVLIARADGALYRAKQQGRNRVEIA